MLPPGLGVEKALEELGLGKLPTRLGLGNPPPGLGVEKALEELGLGKLLGLGVEKFDRFEEFIFLSESEQG